MGLPAGRSCDACATRVVDEMSEERIQRLEDQTQAALDWGERGVELEYALRKEAEAARALLESRLPALEELRAPAQVTEALLSGACAPKS